MSRSALFNLLKLAFAGALIWWVVQKAGGPAAIVERVASMDPGRWVLGLGIVLLANVLSMVRWHFLMVSVGLHSTPFLAIRLGFIGVFFNNVVPGLTGGDLLKAVYVTRENPSQRSAAAISVIVDRVIGIVALALIAAVVIPFDLQRYGAAAVGIYGFLAAAGLGSAVALSRRAKTRLRALMNRAESAGSGGRIQALLAKVAGLLKKIDEAVSVYRDRLGQVVLALVMSVAVHLLIIVAISVFGDALAEGGRSNLSDLPVAEQATRLEQLDTFAALGLDEYCSVIPIIMILSAVPVAPGGYGVGEELFNRFFAPLGVVDTDATTLSLTYRLTATLISLLGGVFLLMDRKRVLEAAAEEPPAA